MGRVEISVVVPCYNEEESIPQLCNEIHDSLINFGVTKNEFEIIIVNDGSSDGTRKQVKDLIIKHENIKLISFRNNKGKSLALMAGFKASLGRIIVTMDGDLQDSSSDIPKLIAKLNEGYDLVSGWREKRRDSTFRKLGSKIYNISISLLTTLKIHDQNSGMKVYRKHLVQKLHVYGQFHRYLPLQAHLLGFRVGEVAVENFDRKYGASKYRALRYEGLFDLLSVLFIFKFSLSPLHFFGVIALALIIPSLGVLGYLIFSHVAFLFDLGGLTLVNRPLLILSLIVLLLGINILLTGFVCDFILHHYVNRNIDEIIESEFES